MSSGWQEAAAQQAEEVSSRLRQLLITGLGLLRSELGLELGLEPQRYPAWVFLAVPVSLGLLFLFLLLQCATSRGSPSNKRAAAAAHQDKELPSAPPRAPAPSKALKVEEPKKKSKKKEKPKPNGRPVELAEEVVIPTVKKETSKQTLDAEKKNEKIKKNKKKPKADSKQTQSSSNQDKKEAEEGNWETKISNKEKRQQRKRDKGADTDAGDTATSAVESYTTISNQSINIRKSKGQSEVSALNGSSWNEKPTKVIHSQLVEEKWVATTNTAGKKKAEPCTWNQDTVDSNGKEWSAPWSERSIFPGIATWSTVDSRLNSSEKRQPFSTIGINSAVSAAASDSVPQTSATEKQWEATPAEPSIDDEWSGLNGLNSSDPSSDWNAPAEEWGNYGEEETAPNPQTEEPEQEVPKVSDDDDDKDKEDQAGQTAASKTKKKKKKKKKQEDSGSAAQEAESTKDTREDYKQNSVPAPAVPTVVPTKSKEPKEKKPVQEKRLHTVLPEAPVSAKHNNPEKNPPQAKQPQENNTSVTKQNSVAPPSQAKSEESWESPKQVKKKKKARRET